ncbi:serine hydrolase [Streptomyces sp. JV185]|uniref:serine hydrolase n=1 Tax=Streptomyces sp. JV185 TaxID=858638 RepID=UPI003FA7D5F4
MSSARADQDRPHPQKAIEEMAGSDFTGVPMRVNDEQGEWVGSAGQRKLGETAKPPTNGHVRIGSSTKTFTATVVLQPVAEGAIGLDAQVAGSTPDGRRTLTAALNYVDDAALSMAEAFQKATQRLVKEVFGGGQDAFADAAGPGRWTQPSAWARRRPVTP